MAFVLDDVFMDNRSPNFLNVRLQNRLLKQSLAVVLMASVSLFGTYASCNIYR